MYKSVPVHFLIIRVCVHLSLLDDVPVKKTKFEETESDDFDDTHGVYSNVVS